MAKMVDELVSRVESSRMTRTRLWSFDHCAHVLLNDNGHSALASVSCPDKQVESYSMDEKSRGQSRLAAALLDDNGYSALATASRSDQRVEAESIDEDPRGKDCLVAAKTGHEDLIQPNGDKRSQRSASLPAGGVPPSFHCRVMRPPRSNPLSANVLTTMIMLVLKQLAD